MNRQNNLEPTDPALSVGDPSADIDALHMQALKEIKKRGESPEEVLRNFDRAVKQLRATHLPTDADAAELSDLHSIALSRSGIGIGEARFFDEPVSAGAPVHSDGSHGRAAEIHDLFGTIDLAGKILAKVSGWSASDSSIRDGDMVLVDPHAEVRDGDILLAHVAGHGLVVKRLRMLDGKHAILESAHPDFPPIDVVESNDLRIHGKVIWRAGPI